MLFAAMLVNALHATLENAVVALNRVRIDGNASLAVYVTIFVAAMVDRVMLGELVAQLGIALGLVRHHMAFTVQAGANDRQNILFPDAIGEKNEPCRRAQPVLEPHAYGRHLA